MDCALGVHYSLFLAVDHFFGRQIGDGWCKFHFLFYFRCLALDDIEEKDLPDVATLKTDDEEVEDGEESVSQLEGGRNFLQV